MPVKNKNKAETIGIKSSDSTPAGIEYIATTQFGQGGIFENIPSTFPIYQPFTHNQVDNGNLKLSLPEMLMGKEQPSKENQLQTGFKVIYAVKKSPCLLKNTLNGKQIIFWDPPELLINLPIPVEKQVPMDLMMGSPNSFILTARLINETMRENDLIHIEKIKAKEPLNVLAWKTRSGELTILTGNLIII